jgi:hypothetical protein
MDVHWFVQVVIGFVQLVRGVYVHITIFPKNSYVSILFQLAVLAGPCPVWVPQNPQNVLHNSLIMTSLLSYCNMRVLQYAVITSITENKWYHLVLLIICSTTHNYCVYQCACISSAKLV